MNKRIYCVALLVSCCSLAQADTISLEDYLACDSVETQQQRVQLTRIVMMTDNEQAKDDATRQLVNLNKEHCVSVSGIFTINERKRGLIKIMNKDGTPLWLVE